MTKPFKLKYKNSAFPFKSPVKKLQVEDTEENVVQINDEGEDVEKENMQSASKEKFAESEKQQIIIDRRKAMLDRKRELGISTFGSGSHHFESGAGFQVNKEEL